MFYPTKTDHLKIFTSKIAKRKQKNQLSSPLQLEFNEHNVITVNY